jgi:hypothetical protein
VTQKGCGIDPCANVLEDYLVFCTELQKHSSTFVLELLYGSPKTGVGL